MKIGVHDAVLVYVQELDADTKSAWFKWMTDTFDAPCIVALDSPETADDGKVTGKWHVAVVVDPSHRAACEAWLKQRAR